MPRLRSGCSFEKQQRRSLAQRDQRCIERLHGEQVRALVILGIPGQRMHVPIARLDHVERRNHLHPIYPASIPSRPRHSD